MNSNIISITPEFGNRSENWLYNQIVGVKSHNIHVYTYNYHNRSEYPFPRVTILPDPGTLTSKLLKLPAYLTGHKRPIADPREYAQIVKALNERHIDMVQTHYGWTGIKFVKLSYSANIPYIVWFYGSDVFRSRLNKYLPELFKHPALFCCTSEALRKRLIETGCAENKIFVFHPGVKIPAQSTERKSVSKTPLHILSVGRLCDFKNPVGMVGLAKILKQRGLDFVWEHCGDGELRGQVESEIAKQNLRQCFLLLGEVPNQLVMEKLKSADIMAHIAVVAPDGARESFGFVLAEASACGVPIVSNRVGGIPEIVQDQNTGFLANEGDIDAMVDKIILLAKNPELRVQMGKNAREYCKNHFDQNTQSAKIDSFYDDLLNSWPNLPECNHDRKTI